MLQALESGRRDHAEICGDVTLPDHLLSLILVLTIILPSFPIVRQVVPAVVGLGTAYFLLIGLGFMLVEIGLIQRLSLFLGHPVYGLAIGLFAIILSTGFGSFLSEHLPLDRPRRLIVWAVAPAIWLGALPLWFPSLTAAFEGADLGPRILVCLAAVMPSGVLMGFGFPSGMRLANAIDSRSTPWLWAINGSAGVLAAGIAVAVSIEFSISTSIWLGAACYLLLAAVAPLLYWAGADGATGPGLRKSRNWADIPGHKADA